MDTHGDVVLVGARDLARQVDAVHVHVDLDVHDPAIAPAHGYAASGGPSAEEVLDVRRRTAARLPVVPATLASYDPSYDIEDRMRTTAPVLREEVAAVAVTGRRA